MNTLPAAVRVRRLWITACALILGLGVAACGSQSKTHRTGSAATANTADANNNGAYVDAGPLTYQLQVSRVLNPFATEDSQYLAGVPSSHLDPGANYQWYGVFLWAKNQTQHPQTTTDNFVVVDTQGNRYYPLKLNTTLNPYAWRSESLAPLQTQPKPDTTAFFGPTQGQLLLFKISVSAYANRPLTLQILGPAGQKQAAISLDL